MRLSIWSRRSLEWDVGVLLPRVLELLAAQELEVLADLLSRQTRLDDVVDEAARRSWEWIGELLHVLALLLLDLVAAFEDDLNGSLSAHHGNFSRRPSVVRVTSQVLGAHDVVGATVGLAGDDGDLGHGGLGKREQELGAVSDDALWKKDPLKLSSDQPVQLRY